MRSPHAATNAMQPMTASAIHSFDLLFFLMSANYTTFPPSPSNHPQPQWLCHGAAKGEPVAARIVVARFVRTRYSSRSSFSFVDQRPAEGVEMK